MPATMATSSNLYCWVVNSPVRQQQIKTIPVRYKPIPDKYTIIKTLSLTYTESKQLI